MAKDTPNKLDNEKTAPATDNQSVDIGGNAPAPEVADNEPLTDRQIANYELRAASGNPRLAYEQYDQQLQAVGQWEQSKHIPDAKRLTWWYPDFGVFVKKDFATAAQVAERYDKISARQPSIHDQLAEGAARAVRDNAARPVPGKSADKDR